MRILLDPAAVDGGNGTPPPPAAPAPAPTHAVAGNITITAEAFSRYQTIDRDYSDLRVKIALAEREAAKQKEDLLAENGKVKLAMEEREKRFTAEIEQERTAHATFRGSVFGDKRDAEVAKALATGYKLRDHAADHLIPILGSHFETIHDPATGKLVVRDKQTHQPVDAYMKSIMARPEFALYQLPSAEGSGNPGGGQRTTTTPNGQGDPPQSWEDSVFDTFRKRQQASRVADNGVPLAFGFGLAPGLGSGSGRPGN